MALRSVNKEIDKTVHELLIIGDIFLYPDSNNVLMAAMADIGSMVFKTQSAKALWGPIAAFYKEYGHLPVDDVTFDTIFDEKQMALLNRAVEEAAKPPVDVEHYKSEFLKSVMTVKLKHAVSDLEADIAPSHNKPVNVEHALTRAMTNLDQVASVSAKLTSRTSFANTLAAGIMAADNFSLREQGERIPIPIEGLALSDNFAKPGSFRGDLNLIVASAGMGKTTVLSMLAAEYARCFGNVLYVTLETSVTPILFKICSYLTKGVINAHDYLKRREDTGGRNLLDTYPSSATKTLMEMPHTINFMDFTCGEALTADAIGRRVRQLRKFNGIDIDIVIVDYIDLMQSVSGGRDNQSSGGSSSLADLGFSYQLLVADELRQMAQQSNVVVWTATQAGKAARVEEAELSKFKPIGQKDIWGSDGKMQFSSIVFGFSMIKLDHGAAVGVMSKIKDRHSIGNMGQYYAATLDYKTARLAVRPLDLNTRRNMSWPDLMNTWINEENKKAEASNVAKRRTLTSPTQTKLFAPTD